MTTEVISSPGPEAGYNTKVHVYIRNENDKYQYSRMVIYYLRHRGPILDGTRGHLISRGPRLAQHKGALI